MIVRRMNGAVFMPRLYAPQSLNTMWVVVVAGGEKDRQTAEDGFRSRTNGEWKEGRQGGERNVAKPAVHI